MKVLKVIHGYPMLYNAGSEVYSRTMAHALHDIGVDIRVFTREENPFKEDFAISEVGDDLRPGIRIHRVNIPNSKDRYNHEQVNTAFKKLLSDYQPDIVHIGHLNHLSTGLVKVAKDFNKPVVYTLHDYWLMCPRGQFLQFNIDGEGTGFKNCENQEDIKCAVNCYSRYFSGFNGYREHDIEYWKNWVRNRMNETRNLSESVDLFLAPSEYLRKKFINQFGVAESRIKYLDYGFKIDKYNKRKRKKEADLVFGYIGTHIPAKGIQDLIIAFNALKNGAILRIWGKKRPETYNYLKEITGDNSKIEMKDEYCNENIVEDVFNHCDVIVVPSIWEENSPLVIHEAQQARVPVITADKGGMSEYVKNHVNGLTFKFRDIESLKNTMQRFIDDPILIEKLSKHGYLFSEDGNIPEASAHARELLTIYNRYSKAG